MVDLLETRTDDKENLWLFHADIAPQPLFLQLIISSVNNTNTTMVNKIPSLLGKWAQPSPSEVLSLLNASSAYPNIRSQALRSLAVLSDDELMQPMLQLI
jgi:hypothetical protein